MVAGEYTKKCLYCGRINAASSLSCAGCGASEFEFLPPTYIPQPQMALYPPANLPPNAQLPVVQLPVAVRVLFCFFIGLLIVFYWLVFATLFLVTVVAQPLAMAMYRAVPVVATLSRTPPPPGESLAEGWRASVERYRAAPIWGKVLAPLIFVGSLVALFYLAKS
jgi:hypothetical protein